MSSALNPYVFLFADQLCESEVEIKNLRRYLSRSERAFQKTEADRRRHNVAERHVDKNHFVFAAHPSPFILRAISEFRRVRKIQLLLDLHAFDECGVPSIRTEFVEERIDTDKDYVRSFRPSFFEPQKCAVFVTQRRID